MDGKCILWGIKVREFITNGFFNQKKKKQKKICLKIRISSYHANRLAGLGGGVEDRGKKIKGHTFF